MTANGDATPCVAAHAAMANALPYTVFSIGGALGRISANAT